MDRFAGKDGVRRTPGRLAQFLRAERHARWHHYALTLLFIALTVVVRDSLGLESTDGESVQVIFVVPILLAAYVGGLGPGLVATLLSALALDYTDLPPFHTLSLRASAQLIEWVTLIMAGMLVSILCELLHQSRRWAENARREQAVTLASIGDAVITTDDAGTVSFLNGVAEQLTGWLLDEAVGRHLSEVFVLLDEGTRQRARDPLDALTKPKCGCDVSRHTLLVARDGSEVPVSQSVAPIRRAQGKSQGVVLVFRDTTRERQAERALVERVALQHELERLVATAPGVLYSFELRPDGSSRIPYASPAAQDIFGIDPAILAESAAPIFARMTPEFAEHCASTIAESARTLTPWRDEFQITRPDGVVRWVEGHSVPASQPDGSILWHGFLNDVTERHNTLESLRAAQETQRLLIQQAPLSIAMFDRDMNYLTCSHRWHEEFGRGHVSLIGRNHYEVLPDIPSEWRAQHAACMTGAVLNGDEACWKQADGRESWLRRSVHPWRDGAGKVGGIICFTENVTQRKAAEIALQRSEQRYRDLVQMSPDPIFTTRNSRFSFANNAALHMFGAASPDEIIGCPVSEFLSVDDVERVRQKVEILQRTGVADTLKHRIRQLNGTWIDVEAVAALITPDATSVQVVARDITERLQQERHIAEREARLSGIINSAMDGIITIGDDQCIVMANPAAERIFRMDSETMLGMHIARLMPDRFREAHARQTRDFAETGATSRRMDALKPLAGLRANGEEFPLEASISAVEVGGKRFSTVILRDISEREISQQALRASDERFRQLAESIREVFWLSDPAKSTIEYVSPAYESIFGRSCERLYESPLDWAEAIHEFDRERVLDSILQRQASGTYDEEYRVMRPDRSIRWIRDRAFPVRDEDGTLIRVAGVAEDITERRELEEQLRQSQKLESIGMLAGGVAHDFNNWLTVIGANGDLLLETLGPGHEGVELVNEIRHAGDRAASLTRQLLAFSRQQVLEPRIVDLNSVVTDTEKMLHRLIGEDVKLSTSLQPISRVMVDPGYLVQVLMNLAVNARDAMPRGGRLTINTSDVVVDDLYAQSVGPMRKGRYVRLTMTDTGVGMSPEILSHVFEPFFTTKGVGRGTGLGLSVVHGIMAQSGGHIDVSSDVGVGTTFRLLFPSVDHGASTSGSSPAVKLMTGNETVLLVEDEVSVRRVAARALKSVGYIVHEAGDGREALRFIEEHGGHVDLLMTDVVMPTMGGAELSTTVQRMYPDMKLLFASGYTDDAVVRNGILHAEVAFLQKPYNLTALVGKVREVLDG